MKCRTDRIPRSAALGDLFEGSFSAICACPVYVYMVQHSVLLRRPPPGANSLHAIFFFLIFLNFCFIFFFFFKKYELIYELEVKSMPKWGNLDLENLMKAKMDNFDEGIWCYLSV